MDNFRLKSLDLVFNRGKKGILKYFVKHWTHVSMAVDRDFVYTVETKSKIIPFNHIVRRSSDVEVWRHDGLQRNDRQFRDLVIEHCGEYYDYLQILGFFLYRLTKKKFFVRKVQIKGDMEVCSTANASWLSKFGVDMGEDKFFEPDELHWAIQNIEGFYRVK